MKPEPLRYQWPPETAEDVARSLSKPQPLTNTVTFRQMDMNEVREALRQNGFTIVRKSRIISCWGESFEDSYMESCKRYGADYANAVRRDVARVAAHQAEQYASVVIEPVPGFPPYVKRARAELVVINQEKT